MPLAAFAAGVPLDQAESFWTDPCPQLQHPAAQLWPQPAAEVGLAQSQVASQQGLPSWSAMQSQLFKVQKHCYEDLETS